MSPRRPLLTLLDNGLFALAICAAAVAQRLLAHQSTLGALLLIVLAMVLMSIAVVRGARKLSQRPPRQRRP